MDTSVFKKWWFWVIFIGTFMFLMSAIAAPNDTNTAVFNDQDQTVNPTTSSIRMDEPASTPKATPKPTPKDYSIKAGMYKVGSDIPAGEYWIVGDDMSYFAVTKDSSGDLSSIITNDAFVNTRYITVKEGQYIELKSCKMYPLKDAPVHGPENGRYNDGMYKVGRDIFAGEYKVISDGSMSYVEIAKDSTGNLKSILTNDVFDADKYITIEDGQYIKLSGCYIQINFD